MKTEIILLIIGGVIFAAIVYLYRTAKRLKNMPDEPHNEKIKILNPVNFSQHTKAGVVLVDFWASWCMPCKMMAPILNEVASEIGDQATIAKVDVEQFQQLSAKFSVRNIPTLILLKNGQEIDRFVGVKPKDFLLKQIRKAI